MLCRYESMVLATILVAASTGVQSYESDFHYGLTYWLARQAGFSALQSHDVARGNERTDTGMLDAKHAIVWQLCFKGDETASELTRELHFRSQVRVPAPPNQRVVDSSAPFASVALKSVMTEPGTEERDRLVRFGRALHGWQDSFSHRGVPSTPSLCPADWMWAHPELRHGALSHDADLTYLFVADCMEAARTTYEHLLAYRRELTLPMVGPEWSALEARTLAFCRAPTKTDKAQWLDTEGVPQARAIAKNTNLADGTKSFLGAPAMDLGETMPGSGAAIASYERQAMGAARDPAVEASVREMLSRVSVRAPEDVRSWFEGFFQIWLTTPPLQLTQALAPYFGPGIQMQLTSTPIEALARLRIRDRGRAGVIGLVLTQTLSQPADVVTAAPGEWRSLVVPVRDRDQAVLIGSLSDDDKSLVAVAVLRHAPYDVLLITAEREDGAYRIRTVNVVPFH